MWPRSKPPGRGAGRAGPRGHPSSQLPETSSFPCGRNRSPLLWACSRASSPQIRCSPTRQVRAGAVRAGGGGGRGGAGSPDRLAWPVSPASAVLNEEQTQFLKELVGPVSRFFEVRNNLGLGNSGLGPCGVGAVFGPLKEPASGILCPPRR